MVSAKALWSTPCVEQEDSVQSREILLWLQGFQLSWRPKA